MIGRKYKSDRIRREAEQSIRRSLRCHNGWEEFIMKNLSDNKGHPFDYEEDAEESNVINFKEPILTEEVIQELSTLEYSTDTEYNSDKDDEDRFEENHESAYELRASCDFPNRDDHHSAENNSTDFSEDKLFDSISSSSFDPFL